jgi:alkylation response protein AidB-like acyl-CoA dehydrogenase
MANVIIDEKNRNKEEIEALEMAEASREQSWDHPSFVADLFMGKLRAGSVVPFPVQSPEDRAIGDAYCARLEEFFKTKVDADRIDREGEIPPEVMKGLAELGAFGMKIPKSYGGLGLSQMNYLRALAVVGSFCGSTVATLSAHQSIGVPQPLLLFGTEEQKKAYLPRLAKGAVSAFALTEPEVGSDPARLSTKATPVDGGSHYLISGKKLWCTNGAIAEILVVMAETPPVVVNGREKKQITAFIVESNTPGFEVIHRCRFMGLNGIQNALIEFKDVKVPKENIIWGTGKGLKLALVTLNAGRLSLPAACVGGARVALEKARQWGAKRVQWGAPVGKHEAGAAKLALLSSELMAIEATTWLGGAWVDRKTQDVRLEAALAKLFASLHGQRLIDECLQLRGGRGYETADSLKARGEEPVPVERWYRDSRINQIVEGTNEIMVLFTSREALDRHLKVAGDALNPKLPASRRLAAFFKAGLFYAFWYPKQWLQWSRWPLFSSLGPLACHMRFVKRMTHKLARTMFHLMVKHGPGLEKKQSQLTRLVHIAMDLYAMAAVIGYALSKDREKNPSAVESAALFCKGARARVRETFRAVCCNHDAAAYRLGRKVLEDKMLWQEQSR